MGGGVVRVVQREYVDAHKNATRTLGLYQTDDAVLRTCWSLVASYGSRVELVEMAGKNRCVKRSSL